MNEGKPFLERYPEFKGQESVCEYPNQPNERRLYTEEDVEEILDKQFEKKEICEELRKMLMKNNNLFLELNKQTIHKDKVKDAIEKCMKPSLVENSEQTHPELYWWNQALRNLKKELELKND